MPHAPADSPRPPSLLELRVLDGANLYADEPSLKLVLDVSGSAVDPVEAMRRLASSAGVDLDAMKELRGDGKVTLVFPWQRRGTAVALALAVARVVDGEEVDPRSITEADPGTSPRVPQPQIPVVAVTGTNGKTTVTRLVAHIARTAGRVAGWSNTDGVYIDGELVEEGDWSGFGGAGRVLADPTVTFAVLETARGGILLRGVGATHNDVSVVTNVSADHLGLHGIETLDELAEVKATVVRVTRTDGTTVLNGEDERVWAMRALTDARPCAFALDPQHPSIAESRAVGGWAASVVDGWLTVWHPEPDPLVEVFALPVTLGGLSRHNTANALAAASAALAVGLPRDAVVEGLRTFAPDPQDNPGRLNIYDVGGRIVIVDMAHNEDGLRALLAVAQGLAGTPRHGRVLTSLGLAGDRTDEMLVSFGRIAAEGSDVVALCQKVRYLRGRPAEEMERLLTEGVRSGGGEPMATYDDEPQALAAMLELAVPGDVVAFTCHTHRAEVDAELVGRGARPVGLDDVRRLRGPG